MMPWEDRHLGQATTDDALHAARGLGAAILIAGVIYVPLLLWAVVGIGLNVGWW